MNASKDEEVTEMPIPEGALDEIPHIGRAIMNMMEAVPPTMVNLSRMPVTATAMNIIDIHAPKALDHFLSRNAGYGEDKSFDLGVKGQYADISRKVMKLKRIMWDDIPASSTEEDLETIVIELIGHLLLTMEYISQSSQPDEECDL